MSSNYKRIIRGIVLTLASITVIFSVAKECSAETIAISKKSSLLLKTSELKVDKKIIAEGPKKDEEQSEINGRASSNINNLSYDIVDLAYEKLGLPYVWGATGPDAFDCSGLTNYVYGQYEIYLPRSAEAQYYSGTEIAMEELQPGDLVFFNTYTDLGHVGIYIGEGDFIHASTDSVIISSIYGQYYSERYAGAVRVL